MGKNLVVSTGGSASASSNRPTVVYHVYHTI